MMDDLEYDNEQREIQRGIDHTLECLDIARGYAAGELTKKQAIEYLAGESLDEWLERLLEWRILVALREDE